MKSMDPVLWLLTLPSEDFLEPKAFPKASTAYQDASSSGFLVLPSSWLSSCLLERFNEGEGGFLLRFLDDDRSVLVEAGVQVKEVHGGGARKARIAIIAGRARSRRCHWCCALGCRSMSLAQSGSPRRRSLRCRSRVAIARGGGEGRRRQAPGRQAATRRMAEPSPGSSLPCGAAGFLLTRVARVRGNPRPPAAQGTYSS